MTKNLFTQYVDICKKDIYDYLKLIFKKDYNQEIAEKYVECYIYARYYNLSYKEASRVFYLRIKETLLKKMEELLKENEEEKKKTEDYITYRKNEALIKNMFLTFDYIFFFDKVRDVENLKRIQTIDEVVDKLYIKREKEFLIKERVDTKEQFKQLLKENMRKTEAFTNKYFADDTFKLDIKKQSEKNNIYNVDIISNIEMPMIYSIQAIHEAFNTETISEEKLLPEFTLLSLLVLRDIVEANFKDEYIVKFPETLIRKKKKIKSVLELLNDSALQDKINLKITYKGYKKNKEDVFELIKDGYKFAIELDETFEDEKEIEKLQMFSYIIVSNETVCKKQIEKNYKKIDKILYE